MTIQFSMVMTRGADVLDVEGMTSALAAHWPDLPPAQVLERAPDSVSFRLGDADVILGRMPAPIPAPDLEGPCATSMLWPKAAEEVATHDAHFIVTVRHDADPIALSALLTKVTAAMLLALPSTIGVYWSNATLVVPKAVFVDFAKEVLPEGPPLHIWVDFRVGRDSSTTSAGFTTGMKALGHMELETTNAPELPADLHRRLMSLAGYLLEKGPVIRDGDTVGGDAQERIRVVYGASTFGIEGQVMRLAYEKASKKKPWWKPS